MLLHQTVSSSRTETEKKISDVLLFVHRYKDTVFVTDEGGKGNDFSELVWLPLLGC